MDVPREYARRMECSRRCQKPFISYNEEDTDKYISDMDQVLLTFRSHKEKEAHKKNMIIQSKLKSTVERLNFEKKSNAKLIQSEALRFRQRSRILQGLRKNVPLNVGCPIRPGVFGHRGFFSRLESASSSAKSKQLTCIIAPSTSDSSSITRQPFSDRKQNSKTKNSDKQPLTDVENHACLNEKNVTVESINMWASVIGEDVESHDVKEKDSDTSRIGSPSTKQQRFEGTIIKDKSGIKSKHRIIANSSPCTLVSGENTGNAEEPFDDKQESDTSSSQEDYPPFAPIDRDECVKIVRRVNNLQTPGVHCGSMKPVRFTRSSTWTKSSSKATTTRVGSSLIDRRLLAPRPRRPSSDGFSGILKVERAKYAMNQQRLADFMQQWI